MQRRQLGTSDVQVTPVALGAWAIGGWLWGGTDDEAAVAGVQKAIDLGMTTIDTAPVYGFGHSEQVVGRAIAGRRDQVWILTKFGLRWDLPPGEGVGHYDTQDLDGHPIRVSKYAAADSVVAECEASLARLGVDCIDLYQHHWPDPAHPIEETMGACARLLEQGKIRAVGVSNYTPEMMDEARKVVPLAASQPPYSMVRRGIEADVIPYCMAGGIGILAYSPLQNGILTGKVTMDRAFPEMPPPGDPWAYQGESGCKVIPRTPSPAPGQQEHDTSYTCVVDRWGNAFSATPSDPTLWTPIVPGLGFIISGRGSQSWLNPDHPSSVEPWKRPRLTPNPAIAFRDGKLFTPFGCPGGDAQCQAMVQTFLNIVEFSMDPQAAIEAPRFASWSFPNSFWPHGYLPGRLTVEGRIPKETVAELSRRGHDVEVADDWQPMSMGVMSAIVVDQESGILKGGADPRRDTYAIGR